MHISRHLEIYLEQDIIDFLNRMGGDFRPDIFESLLYFPMVTHLSLAKPGPSFRVLEGLSELPFAQTLRYLEMRGIWTELPKRISTLCLPKLSHLSLSNKSWEKEYDIPYIDEESVVSITLN